MKASGSIQFCVLLLSYGGMPLVEGFAPPWMQRPAKLVIPKRKRGSGTSISLPPQSGFYRLTLKPPTAVTTTSVLMTFKLPPPPPPKSNDLADLLKLGGGLLVGILVFVSPVGGFVLGFFNSLFLLAIFVPLLATIAFNIWQYVNTISGPCPNCGAPVTVIKTPQQQTTTTMRVPQPSICFSCGSIVQANYDNTAIDNVTGRSTVQDLEDNVSVFDKRFGRSPSNGNESSTTTAFDRSTQRKRVERETKVIDVQVDAEDDKPWQ